ncbi:MAG: methyltransferase type 11, partial [Rubrobacter sp.]|nr:methyltransferase type 11 [Rubrobacter sp.]
ARLLAFEVDDDMAREVAGRLEDPRLTVIHDSAENAEDYLGDGDEKVDIIVSSLPFTTLPEHVREGILDLAPRMLAPNNGSMLVLQYSPTISSGLLKRFATVKQKISPINIPPALLFACEDPVRRNEGSR